MTATAKVTGLSSSQLPPLFMFTASLRITLLLCVWATAVRRANGLAAMDSNGFSDPYALLFLNGEKHKTRTIMKTLNPVWDATFS